MGGDIPPIIYSLLKLNVHFFHCILLTMSVKSISKGINTIYIEAERRGRGRGEGI
jgi:hypothetical protein